MLSFPRLFSALAGLVLFAAPTSLLAKENISVDACNRLYAAILVHDNIYPGATLPATISLDYKKETLEQFYRLSEKLWRDGFDAPKLRATIEKLGAGGTLNHEEAEYYTAVRAKFKQLRFAFAAFDQNHRYPARFDKLTAAMGHFSDALKNNDAASAALSQREVLKLLGEKSLRSIEEEIAQFRPSGKKSFHDYLTSELHELKDMASRRQVTAKQFHEMRKVISRQVAIFDTIQSVNPGPENQQVVRYLSSLNGRMGGMHDELIRKSFSKDLDYRRDLIEVPAEVREGLLNLVAHY